MQKVFRWCDDFNHPTWCYVSFYLKWRYGKSQKLKCFGISLIRTKTTLAKMSGSVINFALTSSCLEKENNTTALERRRKGVPKRLPTTCTGTGLSAFYNQIIMNTTGVCMADEKHRISRGPPGLGLLWFSQINLILFSQWYTLCTRRKQAQRNEWDMMSGNTINTESLFMFLPVMLLKLLTRKEETTKKMRLIIFQASPVQFTDWRL